MMAKRCSTLLVALGVLALVASTSQAQPPAPIAQPTVSPYLNLARRGSSALNYYNLVRPQTQLYGSVQQLQQQVGANRQEITGMQQSQQALPPTGHPAGFFTQGTYFMTLAQTSPLRTAAGSGPISGMGPPSRGPQAGTPPRPRSR